MYFHFPQRKTPTEASGEPTFSPPTPSGWPCIRPPRRRPPPVRRGPPTLDHQSSSAVCYCDRRFQVQSPSRYPAVQCSSRPRFRALLTTRRTRPIRPPPPSEVAWTPLSCHQGDAQVSVILSFPFPQSWFATYVESLCPHRPLHARDPITVRPSSFLHPVPNGGPACWVALPTVPGGSAGFFASQHCDVQFYAGAGLIHIGSPGFLNSTEYSDGQRHTTTYFGGVKLTGGTREPGGFRYASHASSAFAPPTAIPSRIETSSPFRAS